MKLTYHCDKCGAEFRGQCECLDHEASCEGAGLEKRVAELERKIKELESQIKAISGQRQIQIGGMEIGGLYATPTDLPVWKDDARIQSMTVTTGGSAAGRN